MRLPPIGALMALLLLTPLPSYSEVFDLGGNVLSVADASVPTCTDNDGGAGVTQASAACQAMGYASAASAESARSSSAQGGSVRAFAEAQAASIGGMSNGTASASGNANASSSWTITTSHHYSVWIDTSGGATASFNDGSVDLPASGVLAPDVYALQAYASANAIAEDSNGAEIVTAGPREASAEVTFAEVGSSTLILGTITVDGAPAAGLEVRALVGASVVATATTGNDGSYLLPSLPGTVTLEVVDPQGQVVGITSAALTPPQTFDANLSPLSVPIGGPIFGMLLAVGLGLTGWHARGPISRIER